jgi:hypothetical protein
VKRADAERAIVELLARRDPGTARGAIRLRAAP